ncbi:tetratricopeptide repeat protein [Deinococcus sp.]|uniref:tetratricopeptide repeat protein n=1 Tax=Deinococcus sp. TaxID=47478 RepID=UPI0025BB86B8|nr:tetratricopeptide repeat protein [Deinococcus sp.]
MKRLPQLILTLLFTGALVLPGAGATLISPPQPAQVARSVQVAATLLTPDEVIALMNAGRLTEAETAARAASAAHPESARSLLLRARIQARQGRLPEARAALSRAQALPQWDEQELGVPFQSPGEIEQVMVADPAAARGLLADVLLSEGDDPKAYYLLAMTEAIARQWDASRAALARARALSPDLGFADPKSLASLERALQQNQPPVLNGPALAPSPWRYVWWGLGAVLVWFAWWAVRAVKQSMAQEEASRAARVEKAALTADELERQVQQELAGARRDTPQEQRRASRLEQLAAQVMDWQEKALADRISAALMEATYRRLHAAAQSDDAHAAYTAEEAEKAAKEQARLAAEAERRKERQTSGPSSLRKSERSSWSSGRSSSGRDNSGGSKW